MVFLRFFFSFSVDPGALRNEIHASKTCEKNLLPPKEISVKVDCVKDESSTTIKKVTSRENQHKYMDVHERENDAKNASEKMPSLDGEKSVKVIQPCKKNIEKEGKMNIIADTKESVNNSTFFEREGELRKNHSGNVFVERAASLTKEKGNIPFILILNQIFY